MLLFTGVGVCGGGACLGVSKAALKKLNLKVVICVFTSLEERMFGSCLEGLSCSKTTERLVELPGLQQGLSTPLAGGYPPLWDNFTSLPQQGLGWW